MPEQKQPGSRQCDDLCVDGKKSTKEGASAPRRSLDEGPATLRQTLEHAQPEWYTQACGSGGDNVGWVQVHE